VVSILNQQAAEITAIFEKASQLVVSNCQDACRVPVRLNVATLLDSCIVFASNTSVIQLDRSDGGGVTRPLPRDEGGRGEIPRRSNSRAIIQKSGPEVKNGKSSSKNGAPERLGCGSIYKEVSWILQVKSAGASQEESSVLSCIGKRAKEDCDRGSEVETVHSVRDGKGPVPLRNPKESEERIVRKILSLFCGLCDMLIFVRKIAIKCN